ncbi:MAG: signal recognition particle-docking protein FtsY [Actinomycetia bacterium]|nr:signal recognition particle-docking protein FtsY [Actinomycetes bacterium]MCP4959081.1 signal recognition particle-docking protein FtsY [Actinomycetes bacterium]
MDPLILILIIVGALVLASLPFVHRAWSRRGGVPGEIAPDRERPSIVDTRPPDLGDAPTVEAPPEVEPEPEVVEEAPSFFARLGKARSTVAGYFGSVLSRGVDDDTWDELEEALIRADVGVAATTELLDTLRDRAKQDGIKESADLIAALGDEMKNILDADRTLDSTDEGQTVWLFVGVNGVGKTTTIGKVGKRLTDEGKQVLMAAGDTFRAAAAEQLGTWAERCNAELVRGAEGADPSSVIFDGVQAGWSRGVDVVLADTAGRLHTKSNLMEELRKVRRVAEREPGVVAETLLVIDATTGQNGLVQARQFTEAVDVTGVVLTKLDGSAKGGIVFAIERDLGIPVKLVGLGEGAADLVDFDAGDFVDALLG